MSSYRRFISYMYDYHNGQKRKNCGFIKVEIKNNRCIIFFQLKNVSCQEKCNVYLYCQGQEPEFVFLQEIPVKNGMVNYKMDISSVQMTPQCKGLLCTDEKGNDCGTCWEGDGLPEYQPKISDKIEKVQVEPANETIQESITESKPITETTEEADSTTPSRPRTFSELWEHMQKEFPVLEPFEDHALVETIQIAPSDLGYLQAYGLNVGTNQFLLHGYQTYNHLLLGRTHGQMRYILGIPGIYDSQEQFMAKTFGFPCFKPIRECRQKNGQFGYWLRCFHQNDIN